MGHTIAQIPVASPRYSRHRISLVGVYGVLHYFKPIGLSTAGTGQRRKFQALFPVIGQPVEDRILALTRPAIYQDNYKPSTCPDQVHENLAGWAVGLVIAYRHAENHCIQKAATYALDTGDDAVRDIKKESWGHHKVECCFADL